MESQQIVSAATRGMIPHMLWQVSSRFLTFIILAVSVRAIGPSHFAYNEVRLQILREIVIIVSNGTKTIAIRAKDDETAAALLYLGSVGSAAAALVAGICFWFWDQERGGPIALVALGSTFFSFAQRGRIFARRRARYERLASARAFSRICGSSITVVAVVVLPQNLVGQYAKPIGYFIHMLILFYALEVAAGPFIPRMTPAKVRRTLDTEEVKLAAIAVWESICKFSLTNAESVMLDLTCPDNVKAAYKLAANICTNLGRFFNDALEEQVLAIFSTFNRSLGENTMQKETFDVRSGKGIPTGSAVSSAIPSNGSSTVRCYVTMEDYASVLQMSIKAALLASLTIALLGSPFSFTFVRILYGTTWVYETPVVTIVNLYLAFLVLQAVEKVADTLVEGTAKSSELRNKSIFSVCSGLTYLWAMYVFSRRFSAYGIIFVCCINSTALTVFSCAYFARFTGKPVKELLRGVPHCGVLVLLMLAACICHLVDFQVRNSFRTQDWKSVISSLAVLASSVLLALLVVFLAVLRLEKSFIEFCTCFRKAEQMTQRRSDQKDEPHQD